MTERQSSSRHPRPSAPRCPHTVDRTVLDVTDSVLDVPLSPSDALFRELADTAPVAIFTLDRSGRCDYVNPVFVDLTGHPARTVLGTGWLGIVHSDDRDAVQLALGALLQIGSANVACAVVQPGGTTRPFIITAQRLPSGGYVGTLTDPTRGWMP